MSNDILDMLVPHAVHTGQARLAGWRQIRVKIQRHLSLKFTSRTRAGKSTMCHAQNESRRSEAVAPSLVYGPTGAKAESSANDQALEVAALLRTTLPGW